MFDSMNLLNVFLKHSKLTYLAEKVAFGYIGYLTLPVTSMITVYMSGKLDRMAQIV